MSLFAEIDTDPRILREVAEQIKQYSLNQMHIVENYYYKMRSLEDNIETSRYKEIIEELSRIKLKFEDIHQLSVITFAAFLMRKAELLESHQANSNISNIPYSSYDEYPKPSLTPSNEYNPSYDTSSFQKKEASLRSYSVGNNNSHKNNLATYKSYDRGLLAPISNYNSTFDFDKNAFKNGEYQTYKVNEPFKTYRYFGSYDSPGKNNLVDGNYSRSPYESDSHSKEGWGSEAAGRWASPICSNDSGHVRNALALKQSWGNDNAFVCEMEIPKGTVISIGVTEKQDSFEGGGIQIFIHGRYDDIVKMPNGIGMPDSEERKKNDKELFEEMLKDWIKRCGPIENFEFEQNENNNENIQ